MNLIQDNYNNQIHEQFHSCLNCCFYNVASCMVAFTCTIRCRISFIVVEWWYLLYHYEDFGTNCSRILARILCDLTILTKILWDFCKFLTLPSRFFKGMTNEIIQECGVLRLLLDNDWQALLQYEKLLFL